VRIRIIFVWLGTVASAEDKKVRIFLSLIKHHAMKTYGGMIV
jgi:hypothetical protein